MGSSLIVWSCSFISYSGCLSVRACVADICPSHASPTGDTAVLVLVLPKPIWSTNFVLPLDGISQWVLHPQKSTQSKKKITFFQKSLLHLVRSVRCLCGFGPLPWWSFTLGGYGNSQWVLPLWKELFLPFFGFFCPIFRICFGRSDVFVVYGTSLDALSHGMGMRIPQWVLPQNPVLLFLGGVCFGRSDFFVPYWVSLGGFSPGWDW